LSLAPEQLQWQAQELGVLIHFNLETFGSVGYESLNIPSPSSFNPYLLNTDNWVQTMVDFGAQDAVLVAKVRNTKQNEKKTYLYCILFTSYIKFVISYHKTIFFFFLLIIIAWIRFFDGSN